MKKNIIFITSLLAVFAIGFFMSYRIFLKDSNSIVDKNNDKIIQEQVQNDVNNNVKNNQKDNEIDKDSENNDNKVNQTEDNVEPIAQNPLETISAEASVIDRITPSTKLIIQQLYTEDNKLVEEEMIPPYYFIDMTREELIEYTIDYLNNPVDEAPDSKLINFEVISFSPTKVVLRKSYDTIHTDGYYYLTIKDGSIIIYYEDKETIKEHTNIDIEDLSLDEIEELENGLFIYGEEELIELLQNYTS